MPLHPWWDRFGTTVGPEDLTLAPARALLTALRAGTLPGVILVELRHSSAEGYEALHLEVDVERPQDLAHPIRATEPIAILVPLGGGQPRVLALRGDFPDTPHQNWTPDDAPCSLCIDDRPWAETRLTSTPADLIRRVQLWLAKAARGELHDPAQPPDPLFFRSQLALIVPPAALADNPEPAELIACVRQDNPDIIITRALPETGEADSRPGRFVVLTFKAAPQSMTRLRHAPRTLDALTRECERCGIDLLGELRARVTSWAGLQNDSLRRLSARLAIVVAFPVGAGANRSAQDLRAFVTHQSLGEVGSLLGAISKNNSGVGAKEAYVAVLMADRSARGDNIALEPADVHLAFGRGLAAAVAGNTAPDRRRAMLVGAGAIGSQVALNIAREGGLAWGVIDKDHLLPHNLARHGLLAADVGAPKALALARQLNMLLDEPVFASSCDVVDPSDDLKAELEAQFGQADIIIDASASVAVARHLADLPGVSARRFSTFFNPSGRAVVLLSESADRSVTLRDLEAQYHGLLLAEPNLADHLQVHQPGLRYSGSCRALTNRIPATRAAMLSAIAARGITASLGDDGASIRIWTVTDEGEVHLFARSAAPVARSQLGAWSVSCDEVLLATLARHREARLPHETGGILLGIIDVSRRSIHVAHALPQPEDSRGSPAGFERGVVGLSNAVAQAIEASMHQLRYIGEWHSHPRGSLPWPSGIDLKQLAWLHGELQSEGLPALMAIAADNSGFAFMLAGGSAHQDGSDSATGEAAP
jgi:proteasome lid subunit RPN8/RPN11